jgi:serine/threonine protein kinase
MVFDNIDDRKLGMLPILKLGDFGFAREMAFQSMASTLCGSPLYMAPEILKGEKYDAKTDLWSVGAIIYEMVTGRPPFKAQNHIELLRKIEKGDGWIRFPDESPDQHFTQSREYGNGIGNQRRHKQSMQYPQSVPVNLNNGFNMKTLGSNPRNFQSFKIPNIPEDLKMLTRMLLSRDPIRRMSFEEFFIHPTVVNCRKFDSRAKLIAKIEENRETESESLIRSQQTVGPLLVPDLKNQEPLQRPEIVNLKNQRNFDSLRNSSPMKSPIDIQNNVPLEMDPKWMQKHLVKPLPSKPKLDYKPIDKHQKTDPKANDDDSNLSFGSSLDSVEFSSDEDVKKRKEQQETKRVLESVPKNDNEDHDDFVLIESNRAEVKWIPNKDDLVSKFVSSQAELNQPIKEISTISPITYGSRLSLEGLNPVRKESYIGYTHNSLKLTGSPSSSTSGDKAIISHPKGIYC